MNISFLENNPIDTVVINTADGQPLYQVNTPGWFGSRTTFIRRSVPGVPVDSGQLVAEVHWKYFGSDSISFVGTSMPVSTFLRQDGMWSRSRVFTGTDGREYKWKTDSTGMTLVDNRTSALIAESQRSKSGWFSTPRKMTINIHPSGMQTLDAIVVSFIVMEHNMRRQRSTNTSTIAAINTT